MARPTACLLVVMRPWLGWMRRGSFGRLVSRWEGLLMQRAGELVQGLPRDAPEIDRMFVHRSVQRGRMCLEGHRRAISRWISSGIPNRVAIRTVMLLVERHGLRRNGKGTQLPAPEHRKPRADLTSTPVRTGWVVRLCLRPNLDP